MGTTIRWGRKEPVKFESAGGPIIEGPAITPILAGVDFLEKIETRLNVRLTTNLELDVLFWNRETDVSVHVELFHPIDHRLGLSVSFDPVLKEEDQWLHEIQRQLVEKISEDARIHLTFRSKREMVSKWDLVEIYVSYKTWGGTTWCPIDWLENLLESNVIRVAS